MRLDSATEYHKMKRVVYIQYLLAAGLLCVSQAQASLVIDFSNQGTSQSAELNYNNLTITGSANLQLLNLNGLGIVGGASDYTIDGAEWVKFSFTGAYASQVSYYVVSTGNLDGDGFGGEAFIQAFDDAHNSLGTQSINGAGTKDVTALFGGALISEFYVTADVDSHRIGSMEYTLVPEPSSALLFATGALLITAKLRKRRHP